ncbi:MAG: hypothetical protein ACHQ51_10400 [Elusimicrobiota bacterium]
MTALGALILSLLSVPSPAATLSFDAGPPQDAIFSADGYHVARFESAGGEDRWLVDGRVAVRGAAGTLPAGAALSADGAQLLHTVAVADAAGNPLGVAIALNGRRVGAPYPEIRSLSLSAGGRNAAYVAKTPQGWAVVSAQGVGPSFPDPPESIFVSNASTAYLVRWQGAVWLYRDHKPVRRLDGPDAALSADLSRIGAVVKDGGRSFVEVDGERYGPYAKAQTPVFSRNGRHWASMVVTPDASDGVYDSILADGRLTPAAHRAASSLLVDDAGRAFQDVLLMAVDEKIHIHEFYLNGKILRKGGRPPRVGLLAGGAHYVYPMTAPRGIVVGFDGRDLEIDAPLPLPYTPVEFDGAEEYHYWSLEGNSLRLVCGATDGSDPKNTRCAAKARGRFTPVE